MLKISLLSRGIFSGQQSVWALGKQCKYTSQSHQSNGPGPFTGFLGKTHSRVLDMAVQMMSCYTTLLSTLVRSPWTPVDRPLF